MRSDADRDTADPVNITVQAPRGGLLRMFFIAVAAVLATLLVMLAAGRLFDWNPFGSQERDRSGPVVLTAVRDLADYHAASGSYQVLIDLQDDNRLLPDVLKGKRTLFLAIGSVDAVVDFGKLGEDAVVVSEDGTSVTLTLPRAQLARPVIDTNQSRVLDRDLGVIDRLGGLLADDPNPQDQRIFQLAEQRLGEAAKQSELTRRAETNTRTTLARLLKALGFTTVVVNFTDTAAGG